MNIRKLASALVLAAAGNWAPLASASPASMQMAQAEGAKIFHGVGKVASVDARAGVVTLDHEAIPGFMDAMEMQYEAKPPKILEGLKTGDSVAFDVDGKSYALLAIKKRDADK